MLVLGIETSCDETSCAVLENGSRVRSNVIASQIALHAKTGGVVPEVAAREHALKIVPALLRALEIAGLKERPSWSAIRFIAATQGPGLLSSLLMGDVAANTIGMIMKKPIVPVHHIEGHLYANFLGRSASRAPRFPILVLTASGGHNELILWKDHGRYRFLGETKDDAAGEAFDKVARLLGFPYPGGPEIERHAAAGDPSKYPLPRAWLLPWRPGKNQINYHFSFSGLKSAVNRLADAHAHTLRGAQTRQQFTADVAAGFQDSVIDVLSTKLFEAAKRFDVAEVHLTGGVSANKTLRAAVEKKLATLLHPPRFRFPEKLVYCTDNAAMIAACAYFKHKKLGEKAFLNGKPVLPHPNLAIKNWRGKK